MCSDRYCLQKLKLHMLYVQKLCAERHKLGNTMTTAQLSIAYDTFFRHLVNNHTHCADADKCQEGSSVAYWNTLTAVDRRRYLAQVAEFRAWFKTKNDPKLKWLLKGRFSSAIESFHSIINLYANKDSYYPASHETRVKCARLVSSPCQSL